MPKKTVYEAKIEHTQILDEHVGVDEQAAAMLRFPSHSFNARIINCFSASFTVKSFFASNRAGSLVGAASGILLFANVGMPHCPTCDREITGEQLHVDGGFHAMGFGVMATTGTARYLRERGVPCDAVKKVSEGRPNGIDLLVNGEVQLLVNTPLGKRSQKDDYSLRQALAMLEETHAALLAKPGTQPPAAWKRVSPGLLGASDPAVREAAAQPRQRRGAPARGGASDAGPPSRGSPREAEGGQPRRGAPGQRREAPADPAPRPHRRRRGEARGLDARSIQARRGGRLVLRAWRER